MNDLKTEESKLRMRIDERVNERMYASVSACTMCAIQPSMMIIKMEMKQNDDDCEWKTKKYE